MDELATTLLATLKRNSLPAETKLASFNALKSQIKHQRVPESAHSAIVECVRLAITAQTSTALVQTGFSALGHLIKRLTIQEHVDVLFAQRHSLLPALLERLGDVKEGFRSAASVALGELWLVRPVEVEKIVREEAIQSTHARAKEAGMLWVAKMHAEHNLQFRNFVPPMVECLEHADGLVRETAKTTIIELFGTARDAAKADLKRQLLAFNVRRSIATHILSQLQIPGASDFGASVAHHPATRPETPAHDFGQSTASIPDANHTSSTETVPVEPLYMSSQRELEDFFRDIRPPYEDKETEDNWRLREANVMKMRRLLQGNAPQEFHQVLIASFKNMLDGILKVVNSLRTTMSTAGCQLVQDLAVTLGSGLDSMVEILLQGLEKMSAATKHIAAQNADKTVDTIFARVSYHQKLMQHIWLAVQDKNVQPRQFSSGWLKTILKRQALNKSQFEHSGGVEMAEKTIKKGLADANPKVRENMRGTYWVFAQTWPDKADSIMNSLDPKSKQLLEKDPSNPNAGSKASAFTVSVGPGVTGNVRAAGSRSSLKEAIAAQRKASLAAKQERPTSAMSTFSPIREAPTSVARPAAAATRGRAAPTTSTQSSSSSNGPQRPPINSSASVSGQGSLSSAPMRRPRRPDMPRPATADLYSNRQKLKADTPPRSPIPSPPRQARSSNLAGPNVRPDSAASSRNGTVASNSKTNSPRVSPVRQRPRPMTGAGSRDNGPLSPLAANSEDNFTMVFPPPAATTRMQAEASAAIIASQPSPTAQDASPILIDDDNFTLVIPTRPISGKTLSPLNTQVDIMSTIEDEPTKTMTIPVMQTSMSTNAFTDVVNLHHAGPSSVVRTTSPAQADQLIVFEDTSAEDVVIPDGDISPSRSALEELQPSDQNQQITPIEAPAEPKTTASALPRTRSTSPTKKAQQIPQSETHTQDRNDVLKTKRIFISGIERLKARTLDIHGFRKMQDLIKANTQQAEDVRFDDLFTALLSFITSGSEELKTDNNIKAQALKSQALATLRLLQHQGVAGDRTSEALCAILLASITNHDKNSHLPYELERTADGMLVLPRHDPVVSIRAVLAQTESSMPPSQSRKAFVVTALTMLSKLLTLCRQPSPDDHHLTNSDNHAPTKNNSLDTPLLARLTKVARKNFDDLDAEIRKANTGFCVQWHAAMKRSGEEERFWEMLNGVKEERLSLLAYYIARRGGAA